jgi:arsenate reductase-like glutaredoxin family protein
MELTPEEETSLTYGLKKETLEELRNNVETIPYDEIDYRKLPKDSISEEELIHIHTSISKECLDIAVQRGHEYNADGNMVGSYSEYSLDDIFSIIKIKAIRCKRNPDITKRECPDIINYCIEILRRLE